jgi:UrcA family protein
MYKTLIISALTAVFAMAAPVVHAGEAASHRTADQVTVSTRNVDFQNPAQVERIYNRVVTAARSVCDSDGGDIMTQADDKACEQQAVKDALDELHQPALYQVADRVDSKAAQQYAFNDRR